MYGVAAKLSSHIFLKIKANTKKILQHLSALEYSVFYMTKIVIRIGFEPMTPNLEGLCSIQLSYRTNSNNSLLEGTRK